MTSVLSSAFDLNSEILKAKINLLKHMANILNSEKNKCSDWVNWLTESNYERGTIICYVVKSLRTFMVITVTSCSYERLLSMLSFMKTKLHSTMTQDCLDGLLSIFIKQGIAHNTNVDEVIDTIKTLTLANKRME